MKKSMKGQDLAKELNKAVPSSSPVKSKSMARGQAGRTPKSDKTTNPSMISLESYHSTPPLLHEEEDEDENANKDDLDIILQHQDFPLLVTLAAKVKKARTIIAEQQQQHALVLPQVPHATASSSSSLPSSLHASAAGSAKSAMQPNEVLIAVSRLQDRLLSFPKQKQAIARGLFPITDSLMDDNISLLQKELDRCEEYMMNEQRQQGSTASTSSSSGTLLSDTNKKEAIAVKYSKWQTDILMNWMIEHIDQPFPDQHEIAHLMKTTGLTQSQVVNWTTNVRKRNRKATCQGGKKPHHFIDFLFLKQDREKRGAAVATDDKFPPHQHLLQHQHQPPNRDSILRHKKELSAVYSMPHHHPQAHYYPPLPPPLPAYTLEHHPHPPPQTGYHSYHHHQQQPTRLQSHAESATQYKPIIMEAHLDPFGDGLAPLALGDDSEEEELLEDFSDFWIQEEQLAVQALTTMEPPPLEAATVDEPPSFDMDLSMMQNTRNKHPEYYYSSMLLPSVTNDSHDEHHHLQHPHHPAHASTGTGKRQLRNSPDTMMESIGVDEEDIHSWAAELGIKFEI